VTTTIGRPALSRMPTHVFSRLVAARVLTGQGPLQQAPLCKRPSARSDDRYQITVGLQTPFASADPYDYTLQAASSNYCPLLGATLVVARLRHSVPLTGLVKCLMPRPSRVSSPLHRHQQSGPQGSPLHHPYISTNPLYRFHDAAILSDLMTPSTAHSGSSAAGPGQTT